MAAVGFFTRDEPGGRASIRELVRRAEESRDALEVGSLFTEAAERALERKKVRRGVGLVGDAMRALEQAVGDAHVVATAHLRLAHAARGLGLLGEAMIEYGRAFTLDRTLVAAVQSAREIALAGSAWGQAAQLFEEEIAVVAEEAGRASLLCQEAVLVRDRLEDYDRAVAILQHAIRIDLASVDGHRELADTLVRRSKTRTDQDAAARDRYDAASTLADIADIVPDDERVELLEAALDIAPEHVGAIEALGKVVRDDAERLVPIWARHVESFPNSPLAEELHREIGHAHLRAGRSEDALPHLEHLARRDDLDSALLVVDIHARAGRTDDARTWGAAACEGVEVERRLSVQRHVFQALRERDSAAAFETAREIVRDDPLDAVAIDHCESHATRTEDWPALEALYSDVAARLEPRSKRRISMLQKLAALKEAHRGDLAGALQTWRTVEAEGDSDSARLARAERMRLAERAGEWDELVALLEEDVGRCADVERATLLVRMAEAHRDGRADPESAARAFIRVLEAKGRETALSALSEVLERAGPLSPTLDEAAAYADRAEPERRAAVYRLLGRLLDGWDEHERAFAAWTRAREADPTDHQALERLVELAIATGRDAHAVELISQQVETASGHEAIALHRRIASIAAGPLDDLDLVADALAAALELDPSDRGLAEELSGALERAERHGEQLVVLRLLASSAPDDATRLGTKKRIARLLVEKLRDEDEAITMWEQVAVGTRDARGLRALADEARDEADARRLEVMLRRLAAVETDVGARAEVTLERAEVLARDLARVRDAVGVLVEATASDAPPHLPTLSYLESLAVEVGDDDVLARALEMQIGLLPPAARPLVLARLASLYEGPLDDSVLAVHALERWESLAPDDAEPRRRLIPHLVANKTYEALLARVDRLVSMSPDLRAHFVELVVATVDEQSSPPDERLAGLFVELAARAATQGRRSELLARGAALFEDVGAWASAFDAAAAAVAIVGPAESLLSMVDRLAPGAGKTRALDGIYDLLVAGDATAELAKTLVLRHVKHLERQGRFSDALDRVLGVSARIPTDEALLEALEDLGARASRLPEVLATICDRATSIAPRTLGIALVLRVVRTSFASRLELDSSAYIARAVDLAADDPGSFDGIETTAEAIGRPAIERLMAIYQARSRAEQVPALRAVLLVRLARLMLAVAPGAKESAFPLLGEALALAPADENVFDTIESVASAHGVLAALDEHLEKTIEATMSDEVAATFLRRRARILHLKRGMPSEAADAYLRLWALRPHDPDVFRHLRVCLLETGRIHELISAAERELSNLDGDGRRLSLMREIARMWEEDADNRWEAADAWKRVLEHAPGDTAATDALARLGTRR